MEHKIYLSTEFDNISADAAYIGTAQTIGEMWQKINCYFKEHDIKSEPYCRYSMGEKVTIIDYGSWSRFLIISPALTIEDIV